MINLSCLYKKVCKKRKTTPPCSSKYVRIRDLIWYLFVLRRFLLFLSLIRKSLSWSSSHTALRECILSPLENYVLFYIEYQSVKYHLRVNKGHKLPQGMWCYDSQFPVTRAAIECGDERDKHTIRVSWPISIIFDKKTRSIWVSDAGTLAMQKFMARV